MSFLKFMIFLTKSRFRINIESFFQVNTKGAEVLYSKLKDWSNLDKDTILLDVCCGTGTIGNL